MADAPIPPGLPTAESVAKHNQEVAAKLVNQDITGGLSTPDDLTDATGALDKLAQARETPPEPTPEQKAAAEKEAEDKATADKAAEIKSASDAEAAKRADDIFKDTPGLPPGASPKSSEAFSTIKIKAAQEIAARETELAQLKKEKSDLEEKLKNPIPPETAKELEDHRAWRVKLDVEFDPKFKEFDKTISAAQEFVYAQLKKSPSVTEEIITQIKKYGGPENVNLAKLFDSIKDPTLQRLVESKVADIEMVKYQKDQAVKAAKENLTQYLGDREKQWKESATAHTDNTIKSLDPMLTALEWFKEHKLDEKADAATKKSVEEHNKFFSDTKQQLLEALKDDSPQMRAILLTGMAQLFNLQRVHAATKTALDTANKSLAEITAKWEKVKGASTSRLRESAAPATGTGIKAKDDGQLNTHAGDALDKLAKQVMETRAQAAA